MGQGQGSITVHQKKEPSGPPFVVTSANNGLSVDPVTGRIVLGNDVGGTAANLLNAREIRFPAATTLRFIDASVSDPGSILFDSTSTQTFQTAHSAASTLDKTPIRLFFTNTGAGGVSIGEVIGKTTLDCLRLSYNENAVALTQVNGSVISAIGAGGQNLTINSVGTFNIRHGSQFSLISTRSYDVNITTGRFRFGDIDGGGASVLLDMDDTTGIVLFNGSVRMDLNLPIVRLSQAPAAAAAADVPLTRAASGNITQRAGFTGTVTPVVSITVVNGIVTAVA